MDAATPLVEWHSEDHVALIVLNDAPTRNSLSPAMIDAVCAALERVEREGDVRCAILTGSGRTFCSGGSPQKMLAPEYRDATPAEIVERYRNSFHRLPLALDGLSKPVIAAINGHAIGAGLDLACYCDIRIASEDAQFASSFVKLGLIPGDGGAWILPKVIGRSAALHMMLSGESLSAAQALAIGLVSEAVPHESLLARARAVAHRIAAHPPHATRMVKQLERSSARLDLKAALDLAAHMQVAAHKHADHIEAVTAFLEKRSPQFGAGFQ